jgi:hypothetical protein
MATYYFNPVAGSDSNDGLTPATAKASFDAFRAANSGTFGDTFLLHRGMNHPIANRNLPSGNSASAPTRLGAYGTAQVPYAFVLANASIGLNISQRSFITFEDLYVDGNGNNTPFYVAATATNPSTGHVWRRCKFTNSKGDNPGLYIGRENTTNTSTNYLVEDCEFFDNSASGITLMAVQNATIRRCTAYRNGAAGVGGGHGIHTQSRHTFVSSGWTVTTGTTYSRTLAVHETDVFFVRHPSYPRMIKNTSTPTTPGVGEFGVDSGSLYINANANPNGVTVAYVWAVSTGIIYDDCLAYENIFGVAPEQEGHGMSFDDWTSNSLMRRCVSWNNEGRGFSINGGDNNVLMACVADNNESLGFTGGSGTGNQVRNSVFVRNNRGRGANVSEILFTATSANSVASNNILVGSSAAGSIGINFTTASGCTAETNAIFGYASASLGGTVTGTVTADPQLRSDGSIPASSPCATAGTYVSGVTLANGRLRPGYVPIGAYMAVQPRTLRT